MNNYLSFKKNTKNIYDSPNQSHKNSFNKTQIYSKKDSKYKNNEKVITYTNDILMNYETINLKEDTFLTACYDPILKKFYFLDVINEKVLAKTTDDESNQKITDIYLFKKDKYEQRWKEICDISQFDINEHISKKSYDYLKKPTPSSFLYPENLALNNLTSTCQIPATFNNYEIKIIVKFHKSINSNLLEKLPSELHIIERNVGFFYVVDTIIKDSIRKLLDRLYVEKINEKEELRLNDNYKLNNNDFEQDSDHGDYDVNNNNNKPTKKDKENSEISFESLYDDIFKSTKSKNFKYVLKMFSYEEYMYGDHPICTYQSVRTLVREFEPIKLFLMKFNKEEVIPSITHFPPLLFLPKNSETDFIKLLSKYYQQFDESQLSTVYTNKKTNIQQENIQSSIKKNTNNVDVYSNTNVFEEKILFKLTPDYKQKEYTFKPKHEKRRNYITKYLESGESDFPFSFKIKAIFNLFAIKLYIDNKFYNEKEIDFPYFTIIKNKDKLKSKKNSNNFFNKLANKLFKKKNNKVQNKNLNNDIEDKKHEENLSKKQLEKYKKGLKLQGELNYLCLNTKKEKIEINLSKFVKPLRKNILKHKLNKLNKPTQIKINNENITEENNFFNSYNEIKFYSNKNNNDNYTNDITKNYLDDIDDNQDNSKRILKFEHKSTSNINQENIQNIKPYQYPMFHESLLLDCHYYPNKLNPFFIKLQIIVYYGCYELYKTETRFLMVNNHINLEEKVKISKLLISQLPKETRICLNVLAYDKDKNKDKSFVLGCCSTTLYNENGFIKQGLVPMNVWPLFKIDPRIVSTYDFYQKYNSKEKNISLDKINANYFTIYIEFPVYSKPVKYSLKTPFSYRELLKVRVKEKDKAKSINLRDEIQILYGSSLEDLEYILYSLRNREQYFYNLDRTRDEYISNNHNKSFKNNKNDANFNTNKQGTNNSSNNKDDGDSRDIWRILNEIVLPKIKRIIEKDPLTPLEKEDREFVLFGRDYICTVPSALEIFLRCIDWLDPLQVNIARIYLHKWKRIDVDDAITLLDARFPDTQVRQYAISILKEASDDLINLYMLQMCQSLAFEPNLSNPLSNFLIERSIISPNTIGVSFFWNAIVLMKNPLLKERFSVYLVQLFFLKGNNFFNKINKSYNIYLELKEIGLIVKEEYNKTIGKEEKERLALKKLNELLQNLINKGALNNFVFPLTNSYYAKYICKEKCTIFKSKMVPIKLNAISSDGETTFNIIFKAGDDLRQDVLTLQILRIMDKMWLDNNLDLKITAYKTLPTNLKDGFVQFVEGAPIDSLQIKAGFAGALDRELIIKRLKYKAQGGDVGSNPNNIITNANAPMYIEAYQHENFIKSLAGFCVATCVMGIGDRHLGNVMLKDNGTFFHIDYGHILGNFKYKLGIKRERVPFLLTPELAHVYLKAGREDEFKSCCIKAYNILRKNSNRLINLFIIMTSAGLPEISGLNDVEYLKNMLHLDKENDEDAGNFFVGLINQSKNEKFRLFDNMIHNFKHAN